MNLQEFREKMGITPLVTSGRKGQKPDSKPAPAAGGQTGTGPGEPANPKRRGRKPKTETGDPVKETSRAELIEAALEAGFAETELTELSDEELAKLVARNQGE
ncbi:MAG: hypothetical protein LBS57_02425 [Treponema sp.]|jgi:hypothetical protein|nr:hypothetical protein [Treponema sp.]